MGRVMAGEACETPASELQVEDENELPVIQLCGLVEELRYRPAGCWGRPSARCALGPCFRVEAVQVRAER